MPSNSSRHFAKWRRWLDRIERDQLHDLLLSRHIFRQVQECTAPYAGTYQGADLAQWMTQNYFAFAATAIRRMIEKPNGRWESISLVILLEDLAANDLLLTRTRFRSLYKKAPARRFADRDFNRIARNKNVNHLSAARIRRDIAAIKKTCAPIERLVNKVIAHTELDRRRVGKTKYREFDRAIDLLEATFQTYSLLINARVCRPLVPFDDFDLRPDLKRIWPERL